MGKITVGVILAGGKGKRFGAGELGANKVTARLSGKPMVVYGVELFEKSVDKIVVVVGMFPETVKAAVGKNRVVWAVQGGEPKGTGDAVRAAVDTMGELLWEVEQIVVGYGDHMMFYRPEVVKELMALREKTGAAVALLTTQHHDPDKLAWGRIVRAPDGTVVKIVEQKDASEEERKIREINPGFYCLEWEFIKKASHEFNRSPVSGEYYLTEVVEMAKNRGKKVVAHKIPFEMVGWGVNTREELAEDEKLMRN